MSAATLEAGPDLVNHALLGTDRRPVPEVPGPDAADWLLVEAVRRRAERLVTGATTTVRLGEPPPVDDRPLPPAPARAVLDALLAQRADALVDVWLDEASAAGWRVAPEHWRALLDLARRSRALDLRRLAAVLGPGGVWFARHDPAWSRVVRAAEQDGTDS